MKNEVKVLFYSCRDYDRTSFREVLVDYPNIECTFLDSSLNDETVALAKGYDAICVFVEDKVDDGILADLKQLGVDAVLLRCAGKDKVNLASAESLGIKVMNVPAYSPESIAEHAMTLCNCVNRKIHKAYNRVRDNNFSLTGLQGMCFNGKTCAIVGYGRIGKCLARICKGYGMRVIAYDPYFKADEGDDTESVELETALANADVVFLTTILCESTYHILNKERLEMMKKDSILVNVSRGGLIDTEALIETIKTNKFLGVALDVYEGEEQNAYKNHEDDILKNCISSRLTSFPNVLVTSHQAFLTFEALRQIARKTLENASTLMLEDEN